jgi:hypothetical protein
MTDPASIRMAAFTAKDQTDRRAFTTGCRVCGATRASRSESSTSTDQPLDRSGPSGSSRIDDQPEVTCWVDRMLWGKGIASAAPRSFSLRPPNARCSLERPRTTSVRFEYWRRRGSDAWASTTASHPVVMRRSRKRSCASTEGGEPRATLWRHLGTFAHASHAPSSADSAFDPRRRSRSLPLSAAGGVTRRRGTRDASHRPSG